MKGAIPYDVSKTNLILTEGLRAGAKSTITRQDTRGQNFVSTNSPATLHLQHDHPSSAHPNGQHKLPNPMVVLALPEVYRSGVVLHLKNNSYFRA